MSPFLFRCISRGVGETLPDAVLIGGSCLVKQTLLLAHERTGSASNAGTRKSAGISKVSILNSSPGTALDLIHNKLIVSGQTLRTLNGSTYSGITGQVKAGRSGGDWTGSGIMTSMNAASPSILTTLAVASNADLHKTTFGGQAVTSSDILVMYTYAGDVNLDGKIDADDYFLIDSNLNKPSSTFNYSKGDFYYDGKVNGDDYFIIDSNDSTRERPSWRVRRSTAASIVGGRLLQAWLPCRSPSR